MPPHTMREVNKIVRSVTVICWEEEVLRSPVVADVENPVHNVMKPPRGEICRYLPLNAAYILQGKPALLFIISPESYTIPILHHVDLHSH